MARDLAVGTSGSKGVTVVDPATGEALYQERFVGLNLGHMQISADGQYVYFPWMVYGTNPISEINIRRGWVLASRIARVRLDGPARREAISLDPKGEAIADPHGLAMSKDEQRLGRDRLGIAGAIGLSIADAAVSGLRRAGRSYRRKTAGRYQPLLPHSAGRPADELCSCRPTASGLMWRTI